MTKEEIQKLPVGTILITPYSEIEVALGEEEFDEFAEYLGRWVTGLAANGEEGISYLASYDALTMYVLAER